MCYNIIVPKRCGKEMKIMVYHITEVKKDKNILSFIVEGKELPIIYDIEKDSITSCTGRKLKFFPNTTQSISLSHVDLLFITAFSKYSNRQNRVKCIEKYLPYPELLENIFDADDIPPECPKGFVQWLKENNKQLNLKTYVEFDVRKKLSTMPKENTEIVNFLTTGNNSPFGINSLFIRKSYFEMTEEERHIFNKICKTSMKSFSWTMQYDARFFASYISNNSFDNFGNSCCKDWAKYVDTNRDFRYNSDILASITKERKSLIIIEQENKIKEIENLSNEEFVIVVPKTLQDFTDEGKMQNNCVGYFYHNSIANGENYIYFIRKKSSPLHSYITNRFNIYQNRTVETRKVNNSFNDDENARKLIKKIDEKICELLNMNK